MDFAEVDRRYDELRQQYAAGALSADEFDAALRDLMVQDAQGRWWAKARDSGEWHYHDEASGAWVAGQPPTAHSSPPLSQPSSQPPSNTRSASWPVSAPQPVSSTPSYMPGTQTTTYTGGPEVTPTLTIIFYVASFFVPLVGVILFFLYRNKPHPADQNVAKVALILGIVSFLLSCVCSMMLQANMAF